MAEKKSWRDYLDSVQAGESSENQKTSTWRDYVSEKTGTVDTSTSGWRGQLDHAITNVAGNQITTQVNNWLTNHNNYIKGYQDRYSGRKYTYEDAYVSDSAAWLDTITKQKSEYDTEADNILSYLDQYADYLDSKWVDDVKKTITEARNTQNLIIENATKDNEYWSNWENEDAYKYYQRVDGYNKKYSGMTPDEISSIIGDMEDGEEKDWLSSYKSQQELNSWASVTENEDFAANSGYVSNVKYGLLGKPSFTDNLYAYVNNPTVEDKRPLGVGEVDARYLIEAEDSMYKWDTPLRNRDSSYVRDALSYMTEEEVAIYNYYYATQGAEKAKEYLDLLVDTFNARKDKDTAEKVAKVAGEHPVLASLLSVGTSLGSGFEYVGDVIEYAGDKLLGKDTSLGTNEASIVTNAVRNTVADKVDWEIGNWDAFDFLYNTTMSGVDSIASSMFGGLGGTVLGLSAAAQGTNDALNRGMSDGQAFWNGLFSGVFEGLFETVSLGQFNRLKEIAPNGVKDIIKNLGKSMLVNASEETLTEIANIAYDTLINGEFANYTLEELQNGAWKDALWQVIEAGASGALMGMGMSAVGSTIGYANGNQQAIQQYGDKTDILIQEGLGNDVNSESYKLAQKYQGKVDSGKSLTGAQIRNLLSANQEQITSNDMKKIQKAAEERLTTLGQTKDVAKVAELATKWATGQELSRADKNFLASSEYGSRVANELLPKNIDSGKYSTAWAEEIGTKNVNAASYNKKAISTLLDAMTKAEDPANYKSLEERVGTESSYSVSESGKATISGEAVSLDNVEVKSINAKDMTVTVDGKEVKASEIDFADESQSYLFDAVSKIENITPAAATAIIRDYNPNSGLTVGEYLNGIDEGYTYGYYGYSEADLNAGNFTPKLSKEQMMSAYKLGQSAKKISDTSKTDTIKRMRTAVEAEAQKAVAEGKEAPKAKKMTITYNDKGKIVDFDKAGLKKLSTRQKAAPAFAQVMHEMGLGTNFELYSSYVNADGKRVILNENGVEVAAPAGIYRKSDGTVCIDLNAYNGKELTLDSMSHELTHFIQQWSDTKYQVLADFLIKTYEKTDLSMHERVVREQNRLEKLRNKEVSYDEAFDEVVANAMSKMLADGKVMERLAELRAKDASLAEKLWAGIKKLLNKFFRVYENSPALFNDAADLMELKAEFEQMQKMWAEAFVEASDNFQTSLTASETQTITEAGIGFDEDTKSVYSLHFSTAYKDAIQVGKQTFDTEAIVQIVAKGTGRSIEDARKWVQSEMTIANIVMQNPEFLDFEADSRYEAIKKNSDYPQGTVDLSNLCPKREEFTAMFDRLQKKYPNKLFTAQDVADMRKILSDNDITVACGACFVEDRRQLIGEIADTFINMWKEAVETGKPLQKTNAAGQQSDLLVTKALAKQYGLTAGTKIMATDTYIPNQYDLTTYEGFKLLEKNHPTIAMGFNRYNNSRGQQSARLIEGRAEYNRQILGWSDAKVRSVNNNGGLRIFSFSDFEVVHLLDLVQVIIDCSARGVKIQGYTKIPAFAKLVRNTGVKLNRSLIPKGDYGYHIKDGKVVLDYDTTEGIDINDKNFIDESDNPNVGNIVIGINPTQIGAAMLDPFIDYIIPFHSNKAKEILRKLGTGEWVNYKESQHEKDISTGKASKHNVNIYTEVINKYHPTTKVEFVEAFLKECKRQGKIPRYAEFLNVGADGDYMYREGYHKLLVDFKMFDSDGNILPQGDITPNLDEGFMTELLKAEVDRKQNYEFPQKVYDAIDKKFGEKKNIDNSSVSVDNSSKQKGGNVNVDDNRGIRKVSSEDAGSAANNRGRESGANDRGNNTENAGTAQKASSWRGLDSSLRKRIEKTVNSHINSSKNFEELYGLLVNLTGKSESEITSALYKKAVATLTERLYTDAVNLHSVLFENKWSMFGDDVSKLRKDILNAVQNESTKGELYSSQETDADNAPTFYSQMAKVVEGMKQEKFGASSVISMLRGRGVKAEEIRWSGIQAFLDGKKSVTKAELLDFVNNSMLHIEELLLDNEDTGERSKLPDNYRLEETEDDFGDPLLNLYIDDELVDTFRQAADDSIESTGNSNIWAFSEDDLTGQILNHYAGMGYDEAYLGKRKSTKYDEFKMDGGTNYRELLFKMPGSDYSNQSMKVHWGDENTGVLAHARMQDFNVDGKKMLFIEEIQSDWHNAGQKQGYVTKEANQQIAKMENEKIALTLERMELYRSLLPDLTDFYRDYGLDNPELGAENHLDWSMDYNAALIEAANKSYGFPEDLRKRLDRYFELEHRENEIVKQQRSLNQGIPDAPFHNNYHEYVLKRLLRMAAEEGYDSIGWTTADIQSERWSDAYAEGYRIEYDQDIPKFLKKYGKQWGAEVSKTPLPGLNSNETYYDVNREETFDSFAVWQDTVRSTINEQGGDVRNVLFGMDGSDWIAYDKLSGEEYDRANVNKTSDKVWSMDITPAMKNSVLTEGQALYSTHETDLDSHRAMLANAFEGITQNSNEYKLIQEYKGRIKLLNEYEAKLSDLNAEIRKILFESTGARDTARLAQLQAEAKQVAENINRNDKKLLSLEASEPLRKVIERERKKENQKTKAHVKEIIQNKKVRAEQTEMRHKIRKAIRDLDKLLNRGNKKLNVKEDMQEVVSTALKAADILFTDNYGTYDMLRNGIGTNLSDAEEALVDACTKMLKDLDNMTVDGYDSFQARQEAEDKLRTKMSKLNDVFARERKRLNTTTVSSILGELSNAYAKLKDSDQSYVQGAYSEPVHNFLKHLQEEVGGTIVQDMTMNQLESVYAAYKMVLSAVRNANKLFVKGKSESIEQIATQIVMDFGSRKIPEKELAIAVQKITNKIGWDYEKLYYALDRIGSEAFTELIMNIANSENIVMQDVIEAAEFRDKIVEKYGFNNWDVNKKIDREFLDHTGKKFTMTLGELMSLYAYSRREGAWDHIEYGGFVFGEKALTDPKPADSYKLSKEQCEAITNLLTKEQKGYVEEMQKFLSETMGNKGNEVSLLLYGIKMFKEKNYFPIHVAGQYHAIANESQAQAAEGFSAMSNAGFTHAQNPNAKAPFVLESFNEIWSDHVNEMSRYHGTVPALEDLRRVMNRSFYSESTAESTSVKVVMENHFGEEAVNYFNNLYKEANSGAIRDKLENKHKKLLSLFRKNSVAYSLSVLIQQPASLVRAYALIDKKYFGFKGFGTITSGVAKAVSDKWTKAHTNAYSEMLQYAPGVTMAKEIGGFDTATGGSIRSYLLDTNKKFSQQWKTGTVAEKGKAVLDKVDNNAIANLPNVADKIAWIEIWNACKRETVAKHKDLAPTSAEFLQIVGERFTEVIRATQVYDSIFAKSPVMKSKRLYVQMLVSFMNEPNTIANMVEKAARDATKGDWKQGLRTGAVVIHSIIFTNVLKSIIYAMRDDDEDETYIEKYIDAIVGGVMNDIDAANYIPLLRDVASVAKGYDVERSDMAIFADLFDAIEKVNKYSKTDTEDMTEEQLIELDKKQTEASWKLAESVAAFLGIPVKNIRREVNAVIDHARIASENVGSTTAQSALDKVIDSLPDFLAPKASKTDKLYDAIISGDKNYLARLKGTYKTDDAYQSAVRKSLRENDSRIHDAAQAKYDGNTEEYKRIFREIKDEGKFSFDDIMSAINSEESAIRNKVEPEKVTSSYTASDFIEAIVLGDPTNAQAVRNDIIATHMANGKTEDEAEKAFASSVSSSIGDAYSSGLLDKAGAERMLMEYAGKDEDEAVSKVNQWAFIEAHPECDYFTESNVAKYHEFAEPENISLEVYAQFVNGTKGLETIKDKWGEVEKSVRDQTLEVIDSLPLTWQQKDALYLAAGYSESTIWDVPW